MGEVVDPFQGGPAEPATIEDFQMVERETATSASSQAAYIPQPTERLQVLPADYQPNVQTPFGDDSANSAKAPRVPTGPTEEMKDPCAATPNKRFDQLQFSILLPPGKEPTNQAKKCWEEINQAGGGGATTRCWPLCCYQWEATCFCHQPLYFEEINLERYGYQCGDKSCCSTCCREYCCLQPAASAAHFFGTLPMLPYCMAVDCPGDCIYTLGHYRPGSCNPWRRHWPPCDPIAAAAEGGFWVGLIAAFP